MAKKKPNLKRALRAKAKRQEKITDLGSYDSEFLKRGEAFYTARHPEKDFSEILDQAATLVAKKQYEQAMILFGMSQDPVEKAQVLALQGLAKDDDRETPKYMTRALESDPANVDALSWPVMHSPISVDRERMWEIIEGAEKQLEPLFASHAGELGTVVQAAPYLRTLNNFFNFLFEMEESAAAARAGEKLRAADVAGYGRIEMYHAWAYALGGNVGGIRAVCNFLRKKDDPREEELLVLEMLGHYLSGDLTRAGEYFDLVQQENDMIFSLLTRRYELLPLDAETEYARMFEDAGKILKNGLINRSTRTATPKSLR